MTSTWPTAWFSAESGLALVLSGDAAKAKTAYDDLFVVWKNADPKIPMVNEARAEYAQLR